MMSLNTLIRTLIDTNTNTIETKDTYVIGDVHGCAQEFEKLLSTITAASNNKCKIYQLGDLMDRGPYLKETFDLVKKYDVELIIGNHELNFLHERLLNKYCKSRARQITHGKFNKLSEEEQESILDIMFKSKSHKSLLVTDYLSENENQSKEFKSFTLTHAPLKNDLNDSVVHNAYMYCMTLMNDVYEEELKSINVHGHTSWEYIDIIEQLKEGSNRLNLDSGCVYGKYLTALRLNDMKVFKQEAFKTYCTE